MLKNKIFGQNKIIINKLKIGTEVEDAHFDTEKLISDVQSRSAIRVMTAEKYSED